MVNGHEYKESTDKNGAKSWLKRKEFEDGSSEEIRVEKVSNGYIKTVTTTSDDDNGWKHKSVKSIHEDNPLEEKSLIDKLEEFVKGNM